MDNDRDLRIFNQQVASSEIVDVMRQGDFHEDDVGWKRAAENTRYNSDGRAVISADDEWIEEKEWEDLFEELKKERL